MRRAAGATVAAVMSMAMVASACGGRRAAPARKDDCRNVARAGERWIAAAAEPERADALAFTVEQIDLCQAPGLGRGLAQCLAAAATVAAAASCPGITVVHRGAIAPRLPHGTADASEAGGDDEYETDDADAIDPF